MVSENLHDLISVIVPVYNTSKYLPECIESLINQTHRNLEIILVDDGSTDESADICNTYASKDDRIKVIHKVNGGASAARNEGLDSAHGDYIGFVDSDDWIDPQMYEILLHGLYSHHADIACIDCCDEFSHRPQVSRRYDITHLSGFCYSAENALIELCTTKQYFVNVASKLVRADLFQSIRFSVGVPIGEDELVSIQLLNKACSAVHIVCPCYHYFQHPGSAIHHHHADWEISRLKEKNMFFDDLSIGLPNRPDIIDFIWVESDIHAARNIALENKLSKEIYRLVRQHMKPHISKDSVKLLCRKKKFAFRVLSLGRIPFILLYKGIYRYKNIKSRSL